MGDTRHARGKRGAALVRNAERRARALELRKAGASYQQIGDALGITRQAAHQLVTETLQKMVRPAAQELRELEDQRLDTLHSVAWMKAVQGDFEAIKVVVSIHDRRVRLFGLALDKSKVELSGPDGGPVEMIEIERPLSKVSEETLLRLVTELAGQEGAQPPAE